MESISKGVQNQKLPKKCSSLCLSLLSFVGQWQIPQTPRTTDKGPTTSVVAQYLLEGHCTVASVKHTGVCVHLGCRYPVWVPIKRQSTWLVMEGKMSEINIQRLLTIKSPP